MEKYDPLDDLPVQFRRHSASPTPSHFSIITNTPSPEANTRNQQIESSYRRAQPPPPPPPPPPPHRPHLHPARPVLPPLTALDRKFLQASNACPNPVRPHHPPHGLYCLHSLLHIESSYYTGLQCVPKPSLPPLTAVDRKFLQACNACPTPHGPYCLHSPPPPPPSTPHGPCCLRSPPPTAPTAYTPTPSAHTGLTAPTPHGPMRAQTPPPPPPTPPPRTAPTASTHCCRYRKFLQASNACPNHRPHRVHPHPRPHRPHRPHRLHPHPAWPLLPPLTAAHRKFLQASNASAPTALTAPHPARPLYCLHSLL